MLFHLRDGLCDWAEGEVGVDGHCRQLLSLRLGYQHVVGLMRKKQQDSYDKYVFVFCLLFALHLVVTLIDTHLDYRMGLHIVQCTKYDILQHKSVCLLTL